MFANCSLHKSGDLIDSETALLGNMAITDTQKRVKPEFFDRKMRM